MTGPHVADPGSDAEDCREHSDLSDHRTGLWKESNL